MKNIFWIFPFTFLMSCTGLPQSVVETGSDVYSGTPVKERLEQHVYTLASDSFRGRKAGTEYAGMAADYIVRQLEEIGIEPYWANSFFQSFNGIIFRSRNYQNIVGIIRGNDPVLKNEYIVIGAHYDHVGFSFGQIYNGADDNASGVAALIELGRELKRRQLDLKRSIILIAFDAEETGLLGSSHYIFHPQAPIENIKLMMSIDMVGWYQASGTVNYVGSGTINGGNEMILNPLIVPEGLNVVTKNFETSIFTATDTYPFALRKIPTLYVNTGFKSPYHTPRDDAYLIDYDGMTLITEHLLNLVLTISQDLDYESSGRLALKHKPRQRVDFGVSANIGSSSHRFTGGNVETDRKFNVSFGAGFMSQLNLGILAIRPELHYDHIRAQHPVGTTVTNNITIPLNLVLQTPERFFLGGDIFFGGYYSYSFSGTQGNEKIDFENLYNRAEGGLNFGFGMNLKPFKIGNTYRIGLTDFMRTPNEYNLHILNRTSYYTITYMF